MPASSSKIVILGVSASGKSTFARKLSAKLGIPLTHIDELMWKPNWEYVGDAETVQLIKEAAESERWIIEGYIEKDARIDLFNKADVLMYLDYPAWLPALRYIKRCWQHRKDPRPELPGCPDKFSFEFLTRVYKKKEVYRLEQLFKNGDYNAKIIRLKAPKETEAFLSELS